MSEPRYILSSDGSTRQGEALPPDRLPPLHLAGAELTFIRVDHQTRLQLGVTEVAIATPFRLRDAGKEHLLDPEDRAGLGPLLAAYPTTLVEAAVTADLTLRLAFSNGALLEVPQHPSYEAWQVVGPGARLVVCPPAGAGTLAVWR